MSIDHSLYHYSVTICTPQREVFAALRGLSFAAQRKVNSYVTWKGTTEKLWNKHHHHAKFHFTELRFRSDFLQWATEIVPNVCYVSRLRIQIPSRVTIDVLEAEILPSVFASCVND